MRPPMGMDNWYRDYKEQCDKAGEGNEEKYDMA